MFQEKLYLYPLFFFVCGKRERDRQTDLEIKRQREVGTVLTANSCFYPLNICHSFVII